MPHPRGVLFAQVQLAMSVSVQIVIRLDMTCALVMTCTLVITCTFVMVCAPESGAVDGAISASGSNEPELVPAHAMFMLHASLHLDAAPFQLRLRCIGMGAL